MVRQVHPMSGQTAIADVLDLQHRLPLTWELVVTLEAESWVARKVASMTRKVPLATIDLVDQAVSAIIATESPSRVLTLTQAKIIEADPAGHAARLEAERRRRYVTLSQTDEHGLRHVIARVTAGDAVWVDAMVERVADLIATDHPDDTSRDELRSTAFGWLARPEDLLALLQGRRDEPAGPRKQGRMAVVYVHLHEAALLGLTAGCGARRGARPDALARLRDLLGHAHVTVKPVKDLADRVRLSCYEHPTGLKERVHLITGGDRFPYAGGDGQRVDYDHPQPFQRNGPPGKPAPTTPHRWVVDIIDGRHTPATPAGSAARAGTSGVPPTGDTSWSITPALDISIRRTAR